MVLFTHSTLPGEISVFPKKTDEVAAFVADPGFAGSANKRTVPLVATRRHDWLSADMSML